MTKQANGTKKVKASKKAANAPRKARAAKAPALPEEPVAAKAEPVVPTPGEEKVEPETAKAPAPVKKAARPAKAEKAPKPAKVVTPKAPKAKRLELTTRQREVLQEDAKDSGLKADVKAGKQVTMTAGVMKDLAEFAARGEDATRQRVYQGLLARAEVFVKENGLTQ